MKRTAKLLRRGRIERAEHALEQPLLEIIRRVLKHAERASFLVTLCMLLHLMHCTEAIETFHWLAELTLYVLRSWLDRMAEKSASKRG